MSQQDPDNVNGDGKQPAGEGTFTQSDIDRIVAERLAREREKYADVPELREKAEKWAAFEESQKSELQKAQEAKEAAEREAKRVISQANDRLIQAEFISIASRHGVAHPEDAFALANRSAVEIGEDGKVSGVEAAVQELLDSNRLPLTGKPRAADLGGGAGGGDRPGELEEALTDEERALIVKLNLTEKEYRDGRKNK